MDNTREEKKKDSFFPATGSGTRLLTKRRRIWIQIGFKDGGFGSPNWAVEMTQLMHTLKTHFGKYEWVNEIKIFLDMKF